MQRTGNKWIEHEPTIDGDMADGTTPPPLLDSTDRPDDTIAVPAITASSGAIVEDK